MEARQRRLRLRMPKWGRWGLFGLAAVAAWTMLRAPFGILKPRSSEGVDQWKHGGVCAA